jgi:hypothetical protein
VIISRYFPFRLLLTMAAAALLASTLPADAHAKKRRGGRSKVEHKAPGAKQSAKPPADADDDDDETGTATGSDKSGAGTAAAGDDAGNETASDGARERGGDGDADVKEDRPRRRRARVSDNAEADVSATAEPAASAGGGRWLELAIGGRGFSRNLSYNDQVSPGLRQYQLAAGPAVVADIGFYPIALASSGPGAGLGLVINLEQSIATSSALDADTTFPNGATFPTSMHEFTGGIRYRIPLGAAQLGVAATGGEHAFWFVSGVGADRNQLQIPNMAYQFVRGGLDARVAVTSDFSLGAGAGYRYVLNQGGPIGKEFPHLTVAGVDAGVRAAYAITSSVEARVQADVRRYFYDMHSIRGDTLIAGGAVDQYLSVGFQLALTLDRTP